MRIILILAVVIFSNVVNARAEGSDVAAALQRKGYYELCNYSFSPKKYNELYAAYDEFFAEFNSNADLRSFVVKVDKSFKDSNDSAPFANAPMGFLYAGNHKANKNFFHYSPEYHNFIQKHYSHQVVQFKSFNTLLAALQDLDAYSRSTFKDMIVKLNAKYPALKNVMYGARHDTLTIITKIVRYEASLKRASDYHFDFSGLSLMLHNSDPNDEHLRLAMYKKNLVKTDFTPAERIACQSNANCTSVIFLPGLALNLSGLNLQPTPHTVESVDKARYAALAFAMVPHKEVRYEQIKVQLQPINELNDHAGDLS